MEKKLDMLYNKMANCVNDMIPVDWKKIYFLAEVENKGAACSSVFYFMDEKDVFYRSFEIPKNFNVSKKIFDELEDELVFKIIDIYDCFIENDQNGWHWMNWELSEDGKFSIDFSYEEEGREEYVFLKKEAIWAYEKFGLIPKENSFKKTLLDEYLNEKKNCKNNI